MEGNWVIWARFYWWVLGTSSSPHLSLSVRPLIRWAASSISTPATMCYAAWRHKATRPNHWILRNHEPQRNTIKLILSGICDNDGELANTTAEGLEVRTETAPAPPPHTHAKLIRTRQHIDCKLLIMETPFQGQCGFIIQRWKLINSVSYSFSSYLEFIIQVFSGWWEFLSSHSLSLSPGSVSPVC